MGRTFRDDLARDVSNTFLDTRTGFAEAITVYTDGNTAGEGTPTTGIVDLDDEEQGQGEKLDRPQGQRLERRGTVEIPTSVELVINANGEKCSAFLIRDEIWYALRIKGRDESLQLVAIVKVEQNTTRTTWARG